MRDSYSANRTSLGPAAPGLGPVVAAMARRFIPAFARRAAGPASPSVRHVPARPGRFLPPSGAAPARRARGRPARAIAGTFAAFLCTALLSLSAADRAQAQTTGSTPTCGTPTSDELWCGVLTVRTIDTTTVGCTNGTVVTDATFLCLSTSNLTDDGFTQGGTDYTVFAVGLNSGSLILGLIDVTDIPDNWTLHVAGTPFAVTSATETTRAAGRFATWSGTGLSWTADDTVVVLRLTAASTDAAITSVALTSDPDDDDRDGDDATYAIGDTVQATVTFSADVTVTGAPQLTLDVGGTDRTAAYSSTDSTATQLVFTYTVAEGDADTDGIAIAANKLALNGGTIRAGTVDATLTHAAVAAQSGHKVDGVRPTLTAAGTSTDGTSITLTFSETISSADRINILVGHTLPTAVTVSGATVVLSLGTALGPNQTVTVTISASTVRDAAGNGNASSANDPVTNNVEVTGVAGVAITSDPGGDDNYATGDAVEMTVTFDEAVTVDTTNGTPRIEVTLTRVSTGDRWAGYVSGSGTTALVFSYTVAAGDESAAAGILIPASRLELNGGTILDGSDNAAALGHEGVNRDAGHRVNFAYPALVSAETSTDGATIVLTYDEDLFESGPSGFAIDRYTLEVDNAAAALKSGSVAVVSGRTLTLTPATPVMFRQPVTLSYTDDAGDQFGVVEDLAGNDAPSFTDRAVTNNVVATSDAPANLRATPGSEQVALSWDAPDSGSGVIRHEYRYKPVDGDYPATWTEIPNSAVGEADEDGVTITGLDNGALYTFQVRAVDADGAGTPAETTDGPHPTVSIVAVNAGGDAILGVDRVDFLVTRTGSTSSAVDVAVTLNESEDFFPGGDAFSLTVTIAAGQSSKTQSIQAPAFSNTVSADGTLIAVVGAGTGYVPGVPATASVLMRVAEKPVQVLYGEDGYTVDEDIGTLDIELSAHVAHGLPKPDTDIIVALSTMQHGSEGQRATHGEDYRVVTAQPAFRPADFRNEEGFWIARKTVSVPILDDAFDEEDLEWFYLTLQIVPGRGPGVHLVYPSGEACYSEVPGHLNACVAPVLIRDNDGPLSEQQMDEPGAPLTAAFKDLPAAHDGASAFTFELALSENIEGLSYDKVRDSVLDVTGGRVTNARRLAAPSNRRWAVTVKPGGEGEVSIALPPTTDCEAEGALCTADGRMLANGVAHLIVGPAAAPEPEPLPDFTVRFESVPDTHDGESPVVFRLAFSEEPANYSYATLRDRTLNVWQGSRLDVRRARRLDAPSNRRWEVTVAPVSKADLTVGLGPTRDCADNGAVCTSDGRRLANMIHKVIKGPPGISVADARVDEAADATVDFAVTLSRAASETVTVDYATADGTATAGSDYTATSGALTFAPGETAKTVSVPVLDDSHDEGSETFTLTLSNASGGGAWLKDATATGTIENDDPMPQAWLARFGRTVAEQVIDAVQARLGAAPQPGVEVTLAGQRIGYASGSGDGADDTADADRRAAEVRQEREAQAKMAALSDWLQGETGEAGSRAGLQSRVVTERDLLTGTSFALTAGGEGGGVASLWGRGAISSFDGREGDLTLDGEVTSAMIGADWRRDAWTAGLLVSHARGEGSYRAPAGGGTVSSSVTGLYPYGRYMVNQRVTLWSVAGYGEGTLRLEPEDDTTMETDMSLMMGAVGLRGAVLAAPAGGGPELAVKSDAMAVRTSSEKTQGLAAARADVTRLRLGLEGTWRGIEAGGGTLTPRMEIGVRHDGGDAETGFGLDVGGGLAWSHPANGIAAQVSGRALLTHEAKGFRDRGIAGSLAWDPGRGSGRGPKLTLTQTMGASAAGGVDALLGRGTLGGLGANDDGDELANRRLELRMGYGFSVLGDRFTSTPEFGLALSNGHRDYSLGWRLGLAQRGVNALELKLEATRREKADGAANDNDAEHGIGFRVTARW